MSKQADEGYTAWLCDERDRLAGELDDLRARLEFTEMLLDGGQIRANGIPWREVWNIVQRLQKKQP